MGLTLSNGSNTHFFRGMIHFLIQWFESIWYELLGWVLNTPVNHELLTFSFVQRNNSIWRQWYLKTGFQHCPEGANACFSPYRPGSNTFRLMFRAICDLWFAEAICHRDTSSKIQATKYDDAVGYRQPISDIRITDSRIQLMSSVARIGSISALLWEN